MVSRMFWVSSCRGVAVATLLCALAAAATGCTGKKVPSYKDRIGTIDPATAPINVPAAAE